MKRVLSIVMAVIILSLMTVSAFAYDNEYITVNCPENFEESTFFSENPDDVAAVALEEYTTREDGQEYYTGNYINIWMTVNVENASVFDFNNQKYCDSTAENIAASCAEVGETCEITTKNMEMSRFMDMDTAVCSVYYTAKGETDDGIVYRYNGLTTYMVYVYGEYYVTVCSTAIDDLDDGIDVNLKQENDRLSETAVSSLTLKVPSTEEILAQQEEEADEALKAAAPVFIIAAVVWIIMIAVFIIVIVLVARSCKKVRKAREKYFAELARAQQFVNPPVQNYNQGDDIE